MAPWRWARPASAARTLVMDMFKKWQWAGVMLRWLTLAAPCLLAAATSAPAEETFAVLQTRTGVYTNVTVTKKTKDWIMILHARGAGNVQIADLPAIIQQQLGYQDNGQSARTNAGTASVSRMLASLSLPDVTRVGQNWQERLSAKAQNLALHPQVIWTVLAIALGIYLFFCYCCWLICRKAHTEPGALVWVPLLQILPLLRAAGMSPGWFLAFLLPVFNLLAQIVWYVNIVKARGKSLWVALLLALPLTGPFAFLYLAFSSDAPIPVEKEPELMVLDSGA